MHILWVNQVIMLILAVKVLKLQRTGIETGMRFATLRVSRYIQGLFKYGM